MNSFDSTIESIQNISKLLDEDSNCTAIDKTTGEFCGETESLKIIDQFQKLYETRIQNVDREIKNEFDQVCTKLEISKEWIRNLREQNVMLVQVVGDLEQAACNRVKLLEQKLKDSSTLVSGNVANSMYTEKTINTLSNRVSGLEKDEEHMRQKIEFLQSDIRGLLELIRRAVQEKHWSMEDIKFFEIQPGDIPVPRNCTCDQEDINHKKVQSLKLQIKDLEENRRKMIEYQKELEGKLTNVNSKLETKEDTIKMYASQFQTFSDSIRKRAKFADKSDSNSFVTNAQETFDIMLMADIVENLLVEKDLETKNLQQRLRNVESNLIIAIRDNDRNLNNLKMQLDEKCKTIGEVEQQMANLRKESVEKQGVLTAEVMEKNQILISLKKQMAMLHEQCRYANMQIHFKEDIIKKMRNELKQAIAKETYDMQNVCVDIRTCQEDIRSLKNPTSEQNQVISYLHKVKLLMEQENEDLCKLKTELEKTVDMLCYGEDEYYMTDNGCNQDKIKYKLTKNIEYINKMYSKRQESLTIINSLLQMRNGNPFIESLNLIASTTPCTDVSQEFKLMDIFKVCAVEAQATMEDIKDEMNMLVSSFKCRHQKYTDLNKEVTNVQNQLIRSREKVTEAINRLQLREEEGIRQNERIMSGKIKLKDIKNKINHAQCTLSTSIAETQCNLQENVLCGFTEMSTCNDLLCSAVDEVEKSLCSLQVFQTQGCTVRTDLEVLKDQLYEVDSSVKILQEKIDEAMSEHDVVDTIFLQKEQKLRKLEEDIDVIHTKIQNILRNIFSLKEQEPDCNITETQLYMQAVNEIQNMKQDVHKLRKDYNDLKIKISQKSLYTECDKKTCLWKSKVTDLQDQVKILQHETKCNEEVNNFLRVNLGSMEEELHVVQAKADNYRRSHLIDSMELKKKIIQLENTHTEYNLEEALLRCGCNQFRHDAMSVPQLFRGIQNTIRSTKCGLHELKAEFKKLICQDTVNFCSSAKSFMNLMDNLQKYEDELDNCFQQIEELKNAFYSKDKLRENMDEIIKIQKDSIVMTQAELKELHQKLQEKIDNQDRIIFQYEKEKKDLLKQNELQVQTIGHLQNAVVEAKKCIDQMGHRTESSRIISKLQLQEKTEVIRLLTVYVEETQRQYNECFAEAARQDKWLELQRSAIHELQEKISCMECNHRLDVTFIHITYYLILKAIQEQVEIRIQDIQDLKNKVDTLVQSKCCLENKYLNTKKLWQEAERKLQELRREILVPEHKTKVYEDKECQCNVEIEDSFAEDKFDSNNPACNNCECKNVLYEYDLQSEIEVLSRENEDMKRQLQKYKLDFDIIDKELQIERDNDTYAQQISFELQKLRDTECSLQYENQQLKSNLTKQTQKTKDLLEKLQFAEENSVKFEKLLKKVEDKQTQINGLRNQITNNEIVMKKQAEVIEELEKKLDVKNQQVKEYLSELDDAEEEMSGLHERIKSLKALLKSKSDDMAKLQVDYEVLRNDNSILRMESNSLENKTKEDICHYQMKLKDAQRQLCFSENNYYRVTEDFKKTQEQLIKMSKREADLQECLTNMEKDYCVKLSNMEKEKSKLGNCLDTLRDEFEEIQHNYSYTSAECCKLQDICKSYAEQLELLQQQLQEYKEQNCTLVKEKAAAQQNNCEIISELQETHKSLLDLKRKCQLKNKSLACISAELTETAMSRSELYNQSQYVVSCIRIWMEEQREYVNKLNSKFKSQQQELLQLEFEKKTLLDETKKLRRINHSLMQRIKRIHKHGSRNTKNGCVGCQILPPNVDFCFPLNPKNLSSQKKLNLMKAARRISVCGSAWWFPRMKYLVNELRENNVEFSKSCFNGVNANTGLEENHDCGYQSSTSK